MGFSACTKIETTQLGAGLIPVVDNISTFDTVLEVIANNYIPKDSTRLLMSDDHAAGGINNDPLFGTTSASIFFEAKPNTGKFIFANKDSIVGFDSAVMILQYNGYYGDSAAPVSFNLYEVDRQMQYDSLITPFYNLNPDLGFNTSKFWGTKTMQANRFKDTIAIKRKDSIYARVTNQLRIPLNQELAEKLFRQDTTGAFLNDSAFKKYLPGFGLQPQGSPNSLFYFSLETGSKLEFYFRTRIAGKVDTTSVSFGIHTFCGHANKLERKYAGAEINNFLVQNPLKGATQVYLQSNPGTMATLKIPGISALTNRVIHRAELRVTQLGVPSGSGSQLTPARALYLDVADTGNTFKGIPYDLSPLQPYYCYPSGGLDFAYFGGYTTYEKVGSENVAVYRFNLSRYVQNIVTKGDPEYNFRLSAPFSFYYKNCSSSDPSYPPEVFKFKVGATTINRVADGRVRVAGGNYPDAKLKMQLRIIYSKL